MSGLSPEQNNGVSIENQAQAPEQVSISTLIEIWNYGMNDMLQMLEQVNVHKHLQFKSIFLIRKLPQCIPFYFIHPLRYHFDFGCIKIVLHGSQFQEVLNIGSQDDQFQLSDEFMTNLHLALNLNYNDIHNLIQSPYEVLDQIQQGEMMTANMLDNVKCIIDFALILPEAYESSPHELLYACIWVHYSLKKMVPTHLNWFAGPVQASLVSLKQKIQSGFLEILAQLIIS